jgi:hypothetical protein
MLTVVVLPFLPALPVRGADADATGPTAVVRIKSIDGLVSDALYLAKLLGKEEEAKQFEAFFRSMVPNYDSAGIDTKRPLGLYGTVREDLPNSGGVLLIPVTADKAFLDLLGRYQIDAKKDQEDIYTISTSAIPVPVDLYCRFANKYAYVTARTKEPLAKDKLLDPAKVLGGTRDAVVAATFHLDRIPKGLKDVGLGFMDLGINQQIKYPPAATKVQKDLLQEGVKAVSKNIGSLLKEGAAVDFVLDLDRKTNELVIEGTVNGKKGSRLANDINDLAQAKSLFAGMTGSDAAVSVLMHLTAPDSLRQALGPVIDEAFQKILQEQKDENARPLMEKFFKAVAPTLKAGELDTMSRFYGPGKDNQYTALGGVKLVEGKEIEDAIRAIVAVLPPQAKEPIKLDVETAGDAKIHRLDVGPRFEPAAKTILGSHPVYVTIRPNMALVAVGPDGLKVLKDALGAQPATGPLVQVDVSMARLVPAISKFAAGRGDKNASAYIDKAAKEAFAGGKVEDQIRIRVEGGGNLKAQLSIKAPVMLFLGKLTPRVVEGGATGTAK